jgi:putative inorganic carbon (hco3(-)) transporter
MQLQKIRAVYPSVILILSLVALSLLSVYLLVHLGVAAGPWIIISFTGMLLLLCMVKEYKIGIYFMLTLSVFMAYINRMSDFHIQYGLVLDSVAAIVFIIMLFHLTKHSDWSLLKSPITYLYISIVVYQFLQFFNPNAVSFIGWLVAFRGNTSFLLFLVFYHLFASRAEVKNFTILWIVLGALIAFYGIYQEMFGLNARELAWVQSDPGRVKLLQIWGHMRKFSFLSDPSAFGLYMAFCGLACFVLMLGPFPALYRIGFGLLSIMTMVSMSYSGTRTAIAMVAVGIVFYILMTLHNRQTFLMMMGVGFVAVVLLFGPFYGGTVKRIRSTFDLDQDASMSVRDAKRIRLQSYVLSHPIGGGLNTTGGNGLRYSPGHPLAEGWDPDSGYLLTALEILHLAFFYAVVAKGIKNYYALEDPALKHLNMVYLIPFFALSVAHFTQDAMFQKPVYLNVIATYALVLRLPGLQADSKKLQPTEY